MMVMVANQASLQFGYLAGRYPGCIGHLYSPGGEWGPFHFIPYALDNGAFPIWQENLRRGRAGLPPIFWDEATWRRLLAWAVLSGQIPLWALVPDVVGDRERTLANWAVYAPVVRHYGFRPALAVQNGMTFADVPDSECMLFLGGTDEWKDAAIAPWCAQFPGRVHVGRVNNWDRLARSWRAGAVSVDGTGWWRRNFTRSGQGQLAELIKFITEIREGGPRAEPAT